MEYNFEILDVKTENREPYGEVIYHVSWRKTGTTDDGFTGEFFGETPLGTKYLDRPDFIPFEDITDEQIIAWMEEKCVSAMVLNEIQRHIDRRREQALEPKPVVGDE